MPLDDPDTILERLQHMMATLSDDPCHPNNRAVFVIEQLCHNLLLLDNLSWRHENTDARLNIRNQKLAVCAWACINVLSSQNNTYIFAACDECRLIASELSKMWNHIIVDTVGYSHSLGAIHKCALLCIALAVCVGVHRMNTFQPSKDLDIYAKSIGVDIPVMLKTGWQDESNVQALLNAINSKA